MAFGFRTNSGRKPHPAVPELAGQFLRGEIGKRDFLRTAGWLGVSAASARAFTGAITPTPAVAQETPKRGGSVRYACLVQEMNDPATVNSVQPANVFRNCIEFLTVVDEDNITHPRLAASWDPSDDLKTWRFRLQPNVKWSNGEAFTAEDVAFTINRWIAPTSKSSNKSAFSAISQVEVNSSTEFTLHLSRATVAIPEMLYAYTCAIVHRKFDEQGGAWSKNPIGTGPYTLAEFAVGQKATLRRRDDYWGTPAYLDEIRFVDVGTDIGAHIAALAAGQMDVLVTLNTTDLDLVKRLPNATMLNVHAGQTLCIRMRCDQKPFDDIRVRKAVVLAADNQRMLELGYRGLGLVGENHHVGPMHPEYFRLPAQKRDVAQAKALLAEAGFKDGMDVTLTVGNTQGRWEEDAAVVLQQNVAEAGIRINLNVLPPQVYFQSWDKVPFGATFWVHRPLAVMTLDLAYRGGGAWNESHFANADFDAALTRRPGSSIPNSAAR